MVYFDYLYHAMDVLHTVVLNTQYYFILILKRNYSKFKIISTLYNIKNPRYLYACKYVMLYMLYYKYTTLK